MIGDFILTVRTFIKQNTCFHAYKYDGHMAPISGVAIHFEKCEKCGRVRIIK